MKNNNIPRHKNIEKIIANVLYGITSKGQLIKLEMTHNVISATNKTENKHVKNIPNLNDHFKGMIEAEVMELPARVNIDL